MANGMPPLSTMSSSASLSVWRAERSLEEMRGFVRDGDQEGLRKLFDGDPDMRAFSLEDRLLSYVQIGDDERAREILQRPERISPPCLDNVVALCVDRGKDPLLKLIIEGQREIDQYRLGRMLEMRSAVKKTEPDEILQLTLSGSRSIDPERLGCLLESFAENTDGPKMEQVLGARKPIQAVSLGRALLTCARKRQDAIVELIVKKFSKIPLSFLQAALEVYKQRKNQKMIGLISKQLPPSFWSRMLARIGRWVWWILFEWWWPSAPTAPIAGGNAAGRRRVDRRIRF